MVINKTYVGLIPVSTKSISSVVKSPPKQTPVKLAPRPINPHANKDLLKDSELKINRIAKLVKSPKRDVVVATLPRNKRRCYCF